MKKSQSLVCTILALSLFSGAAAFAQGRDDRGNRQDRNDRGERSENRDSRDRPQQRNDNRYNRDNRDQGDNRWDGRGAGPDHRFNRGDRLPIEYRTNHYVVDDWRGHHLSAPPRGYHWVQSGGDYLLVAIATGLIINALINY
jgi:Ni/Co efflux regulator RcnB